MCPNLILKIAFCKLLFILFMNADVCVVGAPCKSIAFAAD